MSLSLSALPEASEKPQASVGGMTNRVQTRLIEANKAARSRRLRVSGGALAFGALSFVVGIAVMVMIDDRLFSNVGMAIAALGAWGCFLAVLPTDRRIIRGLSVWLMMGSGFISQYASSFLIERVSTWSNCSAVDLDGGADSDVLGFCIAETIRYGGDTVLYITAFLVATSTIRPTRRRGRWQFAVMPRAALAIHWLLIKSILGIEGFIWVLTTVLYAFFFQTEDPSKANFRDPFPYGSIIAGIGFTLVSLMCLARVRGAFRMLLAKLGAGGEEDAVSSAAGVAAVMGGIDVATAIARGSESFRAIGFSELTATDLDSNVASPELAAKAKVVRLGAVDYFVSHSWSDDATAKWRALEKVAGEFRNQKKRDANLWLDRACLDQTNITESLQHLPVHLAGCRELLILAGPSYTTRLWTLLEIFVFVQMGGDFNKIKVMPIHQESDAALTTETLAAFKQVDASSAGCRDERHKEQILGIIETAFGEVSAFNVLVKSILAKAMPQRRESAADLITKGFTRMRRPSEITKEQADLEA